MHRASSLIAAPASRSSSQSSTSATTRGPLGADRAGGVRQVAPQLGVRQRGPGRVRERRHPHERSPVMTAPAGVRVAARISARCIARTPARCAGQQPADVHQAGVVAGDQHLGAGLAHVARLVRAHRHRGVGVLHRERATEAAALLGPRQLDQVEPPHLLQQPRRPVADAAASAASGRSGGRSRGAGSTRRRRSRRARRRGTPRARRSAARSARRPRQRRVARARARRSRAGAGPTRRTTRTA